MTRVYGVHMATKHRTKIHRTTARICVSLPFEDAAVLQAMADHEARTVSSMVLSLVREKNGKGQESDHG